MFTLALETSTSQGSLALFEGGSLMEMRTFRALRGHNSKIYGPLRDLLDRLDGRKLARVVVGTGPGSYAGVRISISIANALALSHGASLIGCSSLIAAEGAGEAKRYWIVGDARRHTWYRGDIIGGKLSGSIVVEDCELWKLAVSHAMEEGIPVHTFDPTSPHPGVMLDVPTASRLGMMSLGMTASSGPVEPSYLAAPYITQPKKPGKVVC